MLVSSIKMSFVILNARNKINFFDFFKHMPITIEIISRVIHSVNRFIQKKVTSTLFKETVKMDQGLLCIFQLIRLKVF